MRHYSVLCEETIRFLAVRESGCYLDATAGLGGHTEAIAKRLTTGRVIACDRDAESLELARQRLAPYGERVHFEHARFSELDEVLARLGIDGVDGLLADLGASFFQMTTPERGFGFSVEGPLDCRMDRSQPETAAGLLNHLSELELSNLIYRLGGDWRSRKLARAIVRARPIQTTRELAQVIESVSPRSKRERLHPATKTFMALRIAVNQEMEELDNLLALAPRLVAAGGRAVIISFHSDEDRRVKTAFRELARSGRATLLEKKVVRPTEPEIRENPPSRSAKLRVVEFNKDESRQGHGIAGDTD